MQRDNLLGLEGADQTHEVVTSHLKKVLFAAKEVGAVEMMGEENKETAGYRQPKAQLVCF